MSDRTVKEGESSSTNRTVRENSGVDHTVREGISSGTLREGGGADSGGRKGSAWLPETLAERFDIVEELPVRGSEADLYIVQASNGQRLVAKIYRRGIQPKEDILKLLRRAEFDHVVQLEEYGEDDGHWWELIEYIEHSSLRAFIDQEGPKLSDSTIRNVLCELNDALTHLHGLPIEHRDLKPDNVLVRTKEPLDLVLADFGIASVMDASVRFTETARTIKYAPPEAIGSITPGEGKLRNIVAIARTRWDYWSLGVILVEMLTGVHPYKDLSEAAIGHRLATQNVDNLVDGVEQEGWRKLCQGLLRRDPGKRWGSEQIKMWLEDEQDPRLTVEDEIAPIEQSVRGIDFNGRSFNTPESLGAALMEDWSKAESFWKRRFQDLQTWIIDTLGQQDRGKALAAVDKDQRRKIDAQIFSLIYILAPSAPLQFKGVGLSPENLELIAKQAAGGDRSARSTLLSLYENDILPLAGAHDQGKGLATIARNWREAVNDYRHKLQDVERKGAKAPALQGDVLATLLAAAIPVSAVVNDLRMKARGATTADASSCSWFRSLGDPDKASIGALMIIPHVIREAEAGAKQRRYDNALKRYGAPARFMLGAAGGLVGGIATAYIPGFIVYWPVNWIWGEEAALTVALIWIVGLSIYGGLKKWTNFERLVGNDSQNLGGVRSSGVFYVLLGAATIAGVLYYVVPEVKYKYGVIQGDREAIFTLYNRVIDSLALSAPDSRLLRVAQRVNGRDREPPLSKRNGEVRVACFPPTSSLLEKSRSRGRPIYLRFECRIYLPSGDTYTIPVTKTVGTLTPPAGGYSTGQWRMMLYVYQYSSSARTTGVWREISSRTFQMNP